MSYDHNNVFAKILRQEIKTNFIFEDIYCAAFHDLYPKARIHVLAIPKGYYSDIYDFNKNASSEELIGFYKGVSKIIEILGLTEDGLRVVSNMKHNGRQEIMHYHVHLLAD